MRQYSGWKDVLEFVGSLSLLLVAIFAVLVIGGMPIGHAEIVMKLVVVGLVAIPVVLGVAWVTLRMFAWLLRRLAQ